MRVKYLSTTLISGWAQCPARALDSYQRRIELGDDNQSTDATRFGNAIHSVMEIAHQWEKEQAQPLEDAHILRIFSAQWRRWGCFDMDYYMTGRNKIVDFVRNSLDNRAGETVGCEIDFVYDAQSDIAYEVTKSVSREYYIDMILASGGVPICSKIDRVDRIPDDQYRVWDYKTNFVPFTRDEVENSKQLGIYDLAVRSIFNRASVVLCTFDMFRHGRYTTSFDDGQREGLRHYLIDLWYQIQAQVEQMGGEGPERRINSYCSYCPLRSGCPEYAAALEGAIIPPILPHDGNMADMFTHLEIAKNVKKLADKRIEELNEMFIAKITAEEISSIDAGDREIYLQQNTRNEYDIKDVFPVLKETGNTILLRDIASINKTAVDRLLQQNKDLKEKIQPLMKTSYAKSTVKARKRRATGTSPEAGQDNEGE